MAAPIIGRELTKVQPRVDFAPDEYRAQIQGWGHRLRWERAMRCPCNVVYVDTYDPTHSAPVRAGRRDCPECRGTGYLYFGAQNVKGLVNDSSLDKRFLQTFGELAFGSARISLLPEHLPAWRDRFVDLDGARLYQEPPRVRKTTVEQPTYPILTRSMLVGSASDPTKPERRDLGVVHVRVADADGVIRAGEPLEGIDFRVTAEGALEWLDDSEGVGPPAVGEAYSLTYTCRPTYIVRSHPHLHRHTYVATKPYLNAYDGFKDYLDASLETLPDGAGVTRGDYFEVLTAGTIDGLALAEEDILVAKVDEPTTVADWSVISVTSPGGTIELVPMTVLALCWLEDLGDPFLRTGLP